MNSVEVAPRAPIVNRTVFDPATFTAALNHLRREDPVMRRLIDGLGPCSLSPNGNGFQSLVRIILSQQLSSRAARALYRRLEALVAPCPITPESLDKLGIKELREAGISTNKAQCIKNLSVAVLEHAINLQALAAYPDERIITELTSLKGIGVWSANNFLIFGLGRPDVFPEGDTALRRAIRTEYFDGREPSEAEIRSIADGWRPYATVGCLYCWRSLDI